MHLRWVVVLLMMLVLVGCGAAPLDQVEPLPTETPLEPTATPPSSTPVAIRPTATFPNTEYFDQLAGAYAESHGITVDEAKGQIIARGELREMMDDIRGREAAIYGGAWWEHEPEFRLVILFTEDPEGTIAPYLAGSPYAAYVEVGEATYTERELLNAMDTASELFRDTEVEGRVSVNTQANRVDVFVPDPDAFRAAVADLGEEIPPMIKMFAYENYIPAALLEIPLGEQIVYAPRVSSETLAVQNGLDGRLTLSEEGCLYLHETDGDGEAFLLLWPSGTTFDVVNGELTITIGDNIYEELPTITWELGDYIGVVGYFPDYIPGWARNNPLLPPTEECPGPYFVAVGVDFEFMMETPPTPR